MAEQEIDELAVRDWFLHADFDEAYRTYHIVGGIIAARELAQKKRAPRSDKGTKRKPEQPSLLEKA